MAEEVSEIIKRVKEHFAGKRLAVLMGGRSREREISFRSGRNVLAAMHRLGLPAVEIDADTDLVQVLKQKKIEIVVNMLHGVYGEDGTVQGLLDYMDVPYTGCRSLCSAMCFHKPVCKCMMLVNQIPTAPFCQLRPNEPMEKQLALLENGLRFPVMVKPVAEGSSFGVRRIESAADLEDMIDEHVKEFGPVLVEEYIAGTEVTVGIVGVPPRVLPILELRPRNEFYDYEAKYTKGMTDFVIPAELPEETQTAVREAAVNAFTSMGCRGLSRIDFIVGEEGKPYLLEINTIPGMTDLSDLPAQAKAEGIGFDELVCLILESAIR